MLSLSSFVRFAFRESGRGKICPRKVWRPICFLHQSAGSQRLLKWWLLTRAAVFWSTDTAWKTRYSQRAAFPFPISSAILRCWGLGIASLWLQSTDRLEHDKNKGSFLEGKNCLDSFNLLLLHHAFLYRKAHAVRSAQCKEVQCLAFESWHLNTNRSSFHRSA